MNPLPKVLLQRRLLTAVVIALLLVGSRWVWPPSHDTDFLASRTVFLDFTGKLPFTTVIAQPFRPPNHFLPLPAADGLRWEKLTLRSAPSQVPVALVLHVQVPRGTDFTVVYPEDGTGCDRVGARVYAPTEEDLALTRWYDIPLCPGAQTVFVASPLTRDHPMVTEVQTSRDARIRTVMTTGGAYIIGAVSASIAVLGFSLMFGPQARIARGMLGNILFSLPFLLYQAAYPEGSPATFILLLVQRIPVDALLAMTVVAKCLLLDSLFHDQHDHPLAIPLLRFLLGASLFTAVLAGLGPYPFGLYLSLAVFALTLAAGVWLALTMPAPTAHSHLPHVPRQTFIEETIIISLVLSSWWVGLKVFDWQDWRHYPHHAAITYFLFGMLILLRTTRSMAMATAAALLERTAREQAEERSRQEVAQRTEIRDLLLMLTHELRTPLGVLRFSLDAIPSMPNARTRAEDAIRSMNALVERCLQAAHLETDVTAEKPERWNPAREIPLLVQQSRSPERVQIHVDDNTPAPVTRQAVLGMIISVLLDNALKYGDNRHPVQVDAQLETRDTLVGLCLTVDNRPGPTGLPDPKLLFQKYYRSAGAHQHTGAGLGLYLAARLTEKLGGELGYQALPNITRFKLWIPC